MKDLLSLLPIVAIFLIFWLLVIRPASRRQKALQSVQAALNVGDDVITSSGFFGTIRRIDDDKVGLEIAEGVVITVARGAIVGQTPDAEATAADEADAPLTDTTPEVEPLDDQPRDQER